MIPRNLYLHLVHCELLIWNVSEWPCLNSRTPLTSLLTHRQPLLCNDWRRSSQLSVVYGPSGKPRECRHCWITGWWLVPVAPMQAHQRQRFSMNQWINTPGNKPWGLCTEQAPVSGCIMRNDLLLKSYSDCICVCTTNISYVLLMCQHCLRKDL